MSRAVASIHCLPSSDVAFAAHAERLLGTVTDIDPAEARRLFEARLRVAYPGAVVRARQPLACVGDPSPLWYAFRDACDGRSSSAPLALVAHDEPAVGELLGGLLSEHGWRLIVTPDPASALAESAGLVINLLVTRYALPGMSGLELAARVREHNPAVHVVVSGHPSVTRLVDDPAIRVVTRPFEVSDFLDYIAGPFANRRTGPRAAEAVTA